MRPCLVAMLFVLAQSGLAAPVWFNDGGQRINGKVYEVACSGAGPSVFHARQEALDQCRMSAASAIQQNLKVKQITIESESDVGFHGEISQEQRYQGLSCKPLKEAVEEKEDHAKVWLLCAFDMAKIRAEADAAEQKPTATTSPKRRVTISTVPACDSILIRGAKARVIRCNANPTTFAIEPGDELLIIRSKQHLPKEIRPKDIPDTGLDIVLEAR